MPTILLFRHGETQWNRAHRIQGQTDGLSPLTLKGALQSRAYGRELARHLGSDLARWSLTCSPLARCTQTLSILCDEAGLDFSQAVYDDRLKEVDCGGYAGKLRSDIELTDPGIFSRKGENSWYFRCPQGESLADMTARLGAWLTQLSPSGHYIAVSHGVAGKVIRGLYSGAPMAQVLTEDSPQDAYFILADGRVERRVCGGD